MDGKTPVWKIAWKSQTLFERLNLLSKYDGYETENNGSYDEFIQDWMDITDEDEEVFKQLLLTRTNIDEFSKPLIESALSDGSWPDMIPLPAWIDWLKEFVEYISSTAPTWETTLDCPFSHVYDLWTSYVLEQLRTRTNLSHFSKQAVRSAKKWLVERFRRFCQMPLYVSFRTYLFNKDSQSGAENQPRKDRIYRDFVQELQTKQGIWSFFSTYPVLARFLVTTSRQWIESITELHSSFETDWEEIYSGESESGANLIDDLKVLTDDRHHDGRAVIELYLSDESTYVFKPRSVYPASIWFSIVDAISEQLKLDFKTPVTIQKDGYGWMEKVPQAECGDREGVSRYYKRIGVLMGLAYYLRFNDCHYQNLIANGEQPVIVDSETLLQPSKRFSRLDDILREEIYGSVVWTGFLPANSLDENEEPSVAALAEPSFEIEYGPSAIRWKNINTDEMTFEQLSERRTLNNPNNLPSLQDEVAMPQEYIPEILIGFKSVMGIISNRSNLLPSDIESRIGEIHTRFIYRNTSEYESILDKMTDVDSLECGIEMTLQGENLLSKEEIEEPATMSKIYASEFQSLLLLDIPYFTVDENEIVTDGSGKQIQGLLKESGIEQVREKNKEITQGDIEREMERIQVAISPMDPPQRDVDTDIIK